MSIDPVIPTEFQGSTAASSASLLDSWIITAAKKLVPYSARRVIRLALARLYEDYVGGEAFFDMRLRTDTAGMVYARDLSWKSTAQTTGNGYRGTIPRHFRKVIRSLGIEYERYIFVDLGSGKGRALLLASEFPFQQVIGVELFEHFHKAAIENLRQRRATSKCTRAESICMDAAAWEILPVPSVYYFYNPFPETVFKAVLSNIEASLRLHPRHLIIVWDNFRPWLVAALNQSTALRLITCHVDRLNERCSYVIATSRAR